MNKIIIFIFALVLIQACGDISVTGTSFGDQDGLTRAGSPLPAPLPKPEDDYKAIMKKYLEENPLCKAKGTEPRLINETYTMVFNTELMKVTISSTIDDQEVIIDFEIDDDGVLTAESDYYVLEGFLDDADDELEIKLDDLVHKVDPEVIKPPKPSDNIGQEVSVT